MIIIQRGDSSSSMDSQAQIRLEHQLEEWKMLNDYVNKMDLGYSQAVVIIVSVFGIITALFGQKNFESFSSAIFVVPVGIEAVLAYLSYQFRITAILRGHLAALEKKMNAEIGDDTHLWNSVLMETYMARNNSINSKMLVPMFFAVFIMAVYSIYLTLSLIPTITYGKVIVPLYWVVIAIVAAIIIKPFMQNEIVRYDTEKEEEVIKKYTEYARVRDDDRKYKNFKYEEGVSKKQKMEQQKDLTHSIVIAIMNAILSVGVFTLLYCCWWKPQNTNVNLPGLENYYAATIGDGIFFSTFLGSGAFFLSKNRILSRKQ